jgi:predicted ATPase
VIELLGIRNFKRFTDIELACRPLTVLTGLNGAGKSTCVQALLLVRQICQDPGVPVVQLNGPYGLALGEAFDVLHPDASEQEVEVRVQAAGETWRYLLGVPDDRSLHLQVMAADGGPAVLGGHGMAFTYLNAERLGPRDQLDVTAEDSGRVGVGIRGEFTAQALALHETREVRAELRHPTPTEHGVTTLRTQVESWVSDILRPASQILRPVRITAQWPPGLTASLIRFQEPGLLSEQIRPANMGFGFSYALPIVVAGLLAPPGGLLIVENPEAHLHPAGQSRLGRFLGRVAGSGTQVVVETHSDHVVNGMRLAAAEDRTIEPEQVVLHFFGDGPQTSPTAIDLTARGGLTTWPEGFFDQLEQDLGRLARVKTRRP